MEYIFNKKLMALDKMKQLNDKSYKLFSYDLNIKGAKIFYVLTYDEVYNKIIKENKYFYENYNSDQRINLFMDIDNKNPKGINKDDLLDDILTNITMILETYNYHNIEILVFDATTETKISFHIIFPNISFKNVTQMGYFMTHTNNETLNRYINEKIIDMSIYRNGCFRTYLCSKYRKDNTLKYYKSFNYKYQNDRILFMDSLVTNVKCEQDIEYHYEQDKHIIKLKPVKHERYDLLVCENITDEQIIDILNLLPESYLNEYIKWLVVLNVMKGLDRYDLFNAWCYRSPNYDESNNITLWNNTRHVFININYLIRIINKETNNRLSYFRTYKSYKPITRTINFKHITGNKRYMKDILTYKIFERYNTIFMISRPGTGKTYSANFVINKHNTNHNDKLRLISISALTSLISQHLESFKDLNIKSYENKFERNDNLAICIYSLLKIKDITKEELSKTVLVIDEASSFLLLTHNKTLNNNIKQIYEL